MKISKSLTINRPAADVWKVLAHDFTRADEWMAAVPKSYVYENDRAADGAPVSGRVCELSTKEDGLKVEEVISHFDDEAMSFTIEVTPTKGGVIPIHKNVVEISLSEPRPGVTEVHWNSTPDLKPAGYVAYPMLKMGFGRAFGQILEELKYFVENDRPHPRKLKAA